MEKIRIWRIVLGIIAALALFVAVLLTLAAATTPEWQVAELQQVNQIHYIGLYQKCVFALRQGPSSFPQWLCTYMPYEQNPINYHNNLIPGTSEVDYNGYGGIEYWRFATNILLNGAALFGFLSFVFVVVEICLDAMRILRCLKVTSGLSVLAAIVAIFFCIGGMMTFAIKAKQSENMYMMELTAYTIFQLGNSFYMGVAAVGMFLIGLVIAICATALVCITANPSHQEEYNQQVSFPNEGDFYVNEQNKHWLQGESKMEVTAELPMITYSASCRSMITPPNHNVETQLERKPSLHSYESEPGAWKQSKFAL